MTTKIPGLIGFVFPFALLAFDPAAYVNPFIGTSNGGNTHPGALVPWGMVSMCPQNVDLNAPGYFPVGYIHGREKFYGFSHTNLSGVGCYDMGSILLMPFTGAPDFAILRNGVSYQREIARPGYYAVAIGDREILSEVTATTRAGMARFSYQDKDSKRLFLNLGRSVSKNKGSVVRIVNDTLIEGYKIDGLFCNRAAERRTYFSMRLNQKPKQVRFFGNDDLMPSHLRRAIGDDLGLYFEFEEGDKPVIVKTGISYVSADNARENLETEISHWDFDRIRQNAYETWNKELSRIEVSGENPDNLIKFYTGIYHILIHPNIISDVNGEYPLMGERQGTGKNSQRERFSVFSLWDTYRTVHPFLTLVYPEIQSKMLNSMVDMYKENGWLPKWEIISNESFTMVGDPALPVIADSYIKGIQDFDAQTAYQAMLKHAGVGDEAAPNIMRPGIIPYARYGFIPQDDKGTDFVWGAVSTSLEYVYSDWTLAQMAKEMKDEKNSAFFYSRSMGYKHFFDSETKLLRPKMKNGEFMAPFDPLDDTSELGWNPSGGKGYVEGTAWQYTWFVPHDIPGLIGLFGGDKPFVQKLQECFDKDYFILSNEPDMAYPYLFNYVKGEEWRTQVETGRCLQRHFTTSAGGLPGNDDTGTISAWLVMTMLGFYPDCPGSLNYAVTAPTFRKAVIKTSTPYYPGKEIVIERGNSDTSARIIRDFSLNGKKQKTFFISHRDLINGGHLYFNLR